MVRSRCFWSLTLAALLSGCASVEVTPLVPAGAPYVEDANPVYVPLAHYGKVYEAVLQTLDDFGFEWPDGNRYDGRIETRPRTAPGLGFFLKPGSPDLYERLLATTQSYRHRVIVKIDAAVQGGFFVQVIALKELEDLPRPIRSSVGSAIFRLDADINRTAEVVDLNVFEPNWIPRGRDAALEQELIRRLKKIL
jgi:hypothetical protein